MATNDFYYFPCSVSNQITYLYFCTLGGLSNPRCAVVTKQDGSRTYHLISVM